MKDKSLSIFLIVLFGMASIVILMLVWLRQMPESERMLATFIGSSGFFVVFIRARMLRSLYTRVESGQLAVKIEVEGES